jgi:peptidoglycan/LPS O-acetylase OafA/YrhL
VKRHDTDFVSAIAGLLFVFLGAILVGGRVEADDFSAAWALPAVLIAIGLVVAAAAANRHRALRSPGTAETGAASEDEASDPR